MKSKLYKRIIFLTNSLLAIFSVCLIYFLHRVDTWSKKDDLIAINTVIESNERLDIQDINYKQLDEKVSEWLANSSREHYRSNRTSREKLSNFLTNIGFSIDEIKSAKSANQDDDRVFSMTKLVLIDSVLGQENNHNILLSDDIDLFLFKANLNDLLIVIDVDTSSIQSSLLDSVIFYKHQAKHLLSPPANGNDVYSSVELLRVIIDDDSLKITFSEPQSHMQRNLLELNVNVPAKILRIENSPSLFALYGMDNSKVNGLQNGRILNELKNIYGELPTQDAKNLIGEDYAKSYKNIEVFGISIPTSNFVYAVLFFLFIISLGMNHTINLCIKHITFEFFLKWMVMN